VEVECTQKVALLMGREDSGWILRENQVFIKNTSLMKRGKKWSKRNQPDVRVRPVETLVGRLRLMPLAILLGFPLFRL
jgi:hypothetical protein